MRRLPGFDYAKPFFYMVTLKKLKGLPAFSQIAADDAPAIRRRLGLAAGAELPTAAAPYLVEGAVTRLFVDVIKTFHEQWRCIEPITCFSVMPDHIHLLVKLKGERRKSLPVIVWQLTKRLEEAYFQIVPAAAGTGQTPTAPTPGNSQRAAAGTGQTPTAPTPGNSQRAAGGAAGGVAGGRQRAAGDKQPAAGGAAGGRQRAAIGTAGGAAGGKQRAASGAAGGVAGGKGLALGDGGRPHCLSSDWHDWIVMRREQLSAFTRYIRENPFRAWLRRQNAAYFGHVAGVRFLGRDWFAYGNAALLALPALCAIKGHRATAEGAPAWDALVAAASRIGPGGAGVSTFMSPLEKACGRALGLAGGKWIVLSPEGFGPRWHPSREYERFCADGRMLFLSLYPAMTREPTKAELYRRCHEMADLVQAQLPLRYEG